ncbi:hypothetical protein ACELLULO517_26960 [Acidisoma cellulosilytica]|uniref:Uncharacterized protein n=1 Tax=Acidisoma cellulosilyticum TaxID=2802395 RepID=A0A963Z7G6_9PROT|nr:hypothetical protein [Acidisoma cellulosilyticum]MCB8883916.1 hypothetical protein [Acidisoma cellulosilyticum]
MGSTHVVDVIAFLWVRVALFEDDATAPDTVGRHRPSWSDLYSVTEARDRIFRILGHGVMARPLTRVCLRFELLPMTKVRRLKMLCTAHRLGRRRFSVSLELAKQGDVTLAQAERFASVRVRRLEHGIL